MRSSIPLATLCLLACLPTTLFAAEPDKDLAKELAKATPLLTEDLGEPVKSAREGMLLWAPNPDGKTWDLLQIYFPQYGGPNTIVLIDLGSGQIKQIPTERGWNFHLCPSVLAPNGKLFISALDNRLRQKICIYDPAKNEFLLDAVKMPEDILGETHPLVLGTDGKIYAIGQHPTKAATACRIDPDTLAVTSFGPIGPSHAPNSCWGYSGGADDRFIYIASGKIPWYLVAYDRQTGKSHMLVETDPVGGMVGVGRQEGGCTASASGIKGGKGNREDYWLFEGKAIPKKQGQKPPWPAAKETRPLPPKPEVNTGLAVVDTEGNAELWVRTAEDKARLPKKLPAAASPEELGWKRYRYQVPIHAHSIYRLTEMPDGRLLGTAGAYEGNFVYDPKTNKTQHLGKIGLSHYATAFSQGLVYMSGYPTSPLYVFDPTKPWTAGTFSKNRRIEDQDPSANPRLAHYLGNQELAGTHKMYGAVTAADGKVYFGGQWIRNGACGGLAWYDPKTGKVGGMWRPFSNYQITHLATADQGKVVVISTRRVDDFILKKPKPEQGALFFLNTATGELSAPFDPLKKVKGMGPILPAQDKGIIGWTEDLDNLKKSILYRVDVQGPRLVFARSLPISLPVAIGSNQQEAWDFRLGPDGQVWTFMDGVLVRIDPADGKIQPVGRPKVPGRIAFAQGKIYLGGTTALRRIKDLEVLGQGTISVAPLSK